MTMHRTTIQADIDFYLASWEHDRVMLRRCYPSEEPYWRRRVETTRLVLATLESLRRAIDAHPQPSRLSLEP